MQTHTSLPSLRAARTALSGAFGLVPTKGTLHDGHLALVRRAKAECAHVGVSIFVNPSQLDPPGNLGQDTRPVEHDLQLLESLGVDLVWTPMPDIVYPPDFQTWITVDEVTKPLEGKARPGHFRDVATITAKLFNAFTPTHAYFGQKNAQHVVVIQRMARDLNFPVEIVVCPTVREANGLALSGRNASLNADERRAATVLFRALSAAQAKYEAGERDAELLRAAMSSTLAAEPLAREEYVSVAHPDTLAELAAIESHALLSLAVRMGKTRLIDNLIL